MQKLFQKFYQKLDETSQEFKRYLLYNIDWSSRLIGIKGARGAGKTRLLFQSVFYRNLPQDHQILYVSLDDFFFSKNRLYDLAEQFVQDGGKVLLLDEVHWYSRWSIELKNIYDDFSRLQVVFTGSSLLHLDHARGDLSRRAIMYELWGLSFREYLNFILQVNFKPLGVEQILTNHVSEARRIRKELRPIEHFKEYLQLGYYPYFIENKSLYLQKLEETILLALNTDLPAVYSISYGSIEKIKLLLSILSESVSFKPNISKLAERIGVTRKTLLDFLKYLEDLRIIKRLFASTKGIGLLQKPEKLYLHHPNLHYAFSEQDSNMGNIRESFFLNQYGSLAPVAYTGTGDFKVGKYTFEIGGKNKTSKQIGYVPNSFVVADDIEIGHQNKIPLWLFGFLY